jgi:hypothetical protein
MNIVDPNMKETRFTQNVDLFRKSNKFSNLLKIVAIFILTF